jgi:hypothetical protein
MAKTSRENMKRHIARGGLERDLVEVNDHQHVYHVVVDMSIPGFLPRQFVSRVVWKWGEDKTELKVALDHVHHDGFAERKEYLRACTTTLVKYTQEAKLRGINQTKVTWTQQVDLGGAIPKWVQNRQGVSNFMYAIEHASYFAHARHLPAPCDRYLSTMRKRFDRSLEIDAARNLRLVSGIQNHDEPYTEAEEEIVRVGMERLEMFRNGTTKVKKAKSLTPTVKNEIAFKEGDPIVWGRSETLVRATKEEVNAAAGF